MNTIRIPEQPLRTLAFNVVEASYRLSGNGPSSPLRFARDLLEVEQILAEGADK